MLYWTVNSGVNSRIWSGNQTKKTLTQSGTSKQLDPVDVGVNYMGIIYQTFPVIFHYTYRQWTYNQNNQTRLILNIGNLMKTISPC